MEQKKPTLWEKMSVFVLTGVVAVSIFVCQWLFGMLYPQDSYRVYTNWEIVEMTTENFLTSERINGLAKVIDRKGDKTLWIDRVNHIAFNSSGALIGVDMEILSVDDEGRALRFSFTLTEGKEQAKLIRLEGYETVENTDNRVPYLAMQTLIQHPMAELANQKPIANQSQFWLIGMGEDINKLPEDGTLTGRLEDYDWLVRADALRLSAIADQTEVLKNSWFVRSENGWFEVTDWDQVSPQYLQLDILIYNGNADVLEIDRYGTLLLEG